MCSILKVLLLLPDLSSKVEKEFGSQSVKTRDFTGIKNDGPLPNADGVTVPPDTDYLLNDYIESTVSLLEDLEKATLRYESGTDVAEDAASIKRTLHKLKGEAGVVGSDDIHELCHQAESAFEELCESKHPDMLLRFKDWVYSAVQSLRQ